MVYELAAQKQITKIEAMGFGKLPICMAKNDIYSQMTQRSWEDQKTLIFIFVKFMLMQEQDLLLH